jgi:hypothetical protein
MQEKYNSTVIGWLTRALEMSRDILDTPQSNLGKGFTLILLIVGWIFMLSAYVFLTWGLGSLFTKYGFLLTIGLPLLVEFVAFIGHKVNNWAN